MKKQFIKWSAIVVVMLGFIYSCGGVKKRGEIKNLSTEEFSEVIQSGDSVIILDVSINPVDNNVMIEGAVIYPIDSDQDANMVVEEFGISMPYAIYTADGSSSKDAAQRLAKKGAKVYNLEDGLGDWIVEDEDVVVITIDSTMNNIIPIRTKRSVVMSDPMLMNHPAMKGMVNPSGKYCKDSKKCHKSETHSMEDAKCGMNSKEGMSEKGGCCGKGGMK